MKVVYAKGGYQFEVRDVTLRALSHNEVLVRVEACGLCGSDLHTALAAKSPEPIGHEVAGVVEKVGEYVTNVKPGDRIVLESGSYDRFSDLSRDGKYDLDNNGRHFFNTQQYGNGMGFAEYLIAPDEVCVHYDGLSLAAATLIEPLGVAFDLVKVSDIELGSTVMVVGIGTIGLCALRLAKLKGAARVIAVSTRGRERRDSVARAYGADEILYAGEDLSACKADRILCTAPPDTMPALLQNLNVGGILSYIGEGGDGDATFDMNYLHWHKLQIRSSYAAPALFFPVCIKLARLKMIDLDLLYTHDLRIDHFQEDFDRYRKVSNAIKAVMFL
ncbi:MAG: zinc-binding dehydrogenase [Oscillospiraceae bacterium]|nr:zinc-binding dehydrogenase [Oscillospiraceae bacterium]